MSKVRKTKQYIMIIIKTEELPREGFKPVRFIVDYTDRAAFVADLQTLTEASGCRELYGAMRKFADQCGI